MYLLDIGIYLVKYAPTSNNTIENNQVKAPPKWNQYANIFKIASEKKQIEVTALFNPFIPDFFSFDKQYTSQ